jgi:hypothetical protein
MDPLAVVVDWLDACRARCLNQLLNFYDAAATLECGCTGPYVYRGRAELANYWSGRLTAAVPDAFRLTNILPGDEPGSVMLDYASYEGKPVRMYFRFTPSGKIAATVCGPLINAQKQRKAAFALGLASGCQFNSALVIRTGLPGTVASARPCCRPATRRLGLSGWMR